VRARDLLGSVLRSVGRIWRQQNRFGRALLVIGAVNVTACLFLGGSLLVYSVLPWRAVLSAGGTGPRLPTAPAAVASLPSLTPSPTSTLWPTPTGMPTATPAPTRTPQPAPTATPPPAARIEVTARMSDSSPRRASLVTVYGQITRDGVPLVGVPMQATWGGRDLGCDDRSNRAGVASCSLPIFWASKGQYVEVQVTFAYEGQRHSATTGFTPR